MVGAVIPQVTVESVALPDRARLWLLQFRLPRPMLNRSLAIQVLLSTRPPKTELADSRTVAQFVPDGA
jgi:hypothetical protein